MPGSALTEPKLMIDYLIRLTSIKKQKVEGSFLTKAQAHTEGTQHMDKRFRKKLSIRNKQNSKLFFYHPL